MRLELQDFAGAFGQHLLNPLPVHDRAGFLQNAERPDELARKSLAADLEVLERALGLGPPVAVRGNGDLAHRVGLEAHLRFAHRDAMLYPAASDLAMEAERRNVSEIPGVERPQTCSVRDRTSRDRQIDLTLARARDRPIELRRDPSLGRSEPNGRLVREEMHLSRDLLRSPRAPSPFVENERRELDSFPSLDESAERRGQSSLSAQGMDQDGSIQVNQRR